MGEPAALSPADRALARGVARLIVEGVANDEREPLYALQRCALDAAISADTLLLWLAQVVMEKR